MLSSKVELVQVQIEPACHAGVAGSAKDPDVGDSTIRPPAKPFVDQAESIEDAAQAKHCMCVHTIRLDILTKKGYADNRTLLPALWPELVGATETVATTCHCTPVNDGELHHGHTLQHGHPSWVTVQVQCKGQQCICILQVHTYTECRAPTHLTRMLYRAMGSGCAV